MVLHLLRIFFILVVLALTIPYAFKDEVAGRGYSYLMTYLMVPPLLAFAVVLVDILWAHKRLRGLSGLFFGILAGAVLAFALNNIIGMFLQVFPQLVAEPTVQLAIKLVDAAVVFLCVTIVLQTRDDFRFIIPYVEFSRHSKGSHSLLLDTSVIIDGRIADIVETRILDGEIVIPRFILTELQTVADSADKLKRARGRRGLDVLGRLQKSDKIEIRILDAQAPGMQDLADADAKLVALAKHLDGKVVTNDYNLNKIAQLRGVEVININDLANALKPVVLPGETLTVKIVKPGEEPGQGVGYLDDGTMVVAEGGRDHLGGEIVITATSVLQTSAGRMIFGRLDADKTRGKNNHV
ncbi:MAG: PIN domain-containing protein [Phycisphaerae bacterium]|jgi:uncharacterized protein YacL